jgi:predicted trehalose synthase
MANSKQLLLADEDPFWYKDAIIYEVHVRSFYDRDLQVLLDAYCLEKAIYELGYELNNRPEWVKVPIQGVRQLLQIQETS